MNRWVRIYIAPALLVVIVTAISLVVFWDLNAALVGTFALVAATCVVYPVLPDSPGSQKGPHPVDLHLAHVRVTALPLDRLGQHVSERITSERLQEGTEQEASADAHDR